MDDSNVIGGKDCRILHNTSTKNRIQVHVGGTDMPICVYNRADSYFAYRIRGSEPHCYDPEGHDPEVSAMKVVEVVGRLKFFNNLPHTLVTSAPCSRCGNPIRTVFELPFLLH